ncbi:hypothetical protein F4820DRAFT_464459 [Hypoxylon rubiginosum]|uniref:Uncharacterized protein n=1 Tax=Hypoxylon rubiginosum TaxID=110542 RepID=A0ACB9YRF5_9PEZI|nr:hypothetical protein F4820DRAFT_464459 [Hypoxylon rubiginosum]
MHLSTNDNAINDLKDPIRLMRQAVQIFLDQPSNQIEAGHPGFHESDQTVKMWELATFCGDFERREGKWTPSVKVQMIWSECGSTNSGRWIQVIENIAQFCFAAGSPEASQKDPFESLQHLRNTLSRHFLYTADLHKQIFDLQAQINQQQRTITALVYRRVLENIVAEENGRGPVEKWKNFLRDRVFFDNHQSNEDHKKNQEDLEKRNQELDEFLKKYQKGQYGQQHIREMTDHLYSTLSRAIHNFRLTGEDDQYDVSSSQFDPMERDFLLALKPLDANVAVDGTVDWEREQERYPIPSHLITSVQNTKGVLPSDLCAPESDTDDGNFSFGYDSSEQGSDKKSSSSEGSDEDDEDDKDEDDEDSEEE